MNSYCMHSCSFEIYRMIEKFPDGSKLFFDDGLASVYYMFEELYYLSKKKDLEIIVAINPYFIKQADKEKIIHDKPITCIEAHEHSKQGNFSYYMNQKMVEYVFKKGAKIALHGYDHFIHDNKGNRYKKNNILKDIQNQILYLKNNEHLFPKKIVQFVWPYNEEIPRYKRYIIDEFKKIKRYLIFFGDERINGPWNSYYNIETLQQNSNK